MVFRLWQIFSILILLNDATHPENVSTPILEKKEQEWINLPQQNISQKELKIYTAYLKYISIYPVGCKIVLNTGEIGTVYAANPDLPSRPFVQMDLKRKDNMNILDLSRNFTTLITGVVKE